MIPADAPIGTVRAAPNGRMLAICQVNNGECTWWIHHLYQPYKLKEMSGVWRTIPTWPVVYCPTEPQEDLQSHREPPPSGYRAGGPNG